MASRIVEAEFCRRSRHHLASAEDPKPPPVWLRSIHHSARFSRNRRNTVAPYGLDP
jgi:hypothetical protein